ncbi:MAG: protein tyrosine kinase [Gammaproteobacteria bacterium]|nr:protein tyrosine kinase [Gammaproteobacteria bacterium]
METPAKRTLSIDLGRLERSGIFTPESRNYQLAEELRVIKRRLLINAAGLGDMPIEHGNLIMVTSSTPGEGKTFIASNLAISIEMEIDHTVLLVDADAARAGTSHVFGVESELGLSDLLMRSDLDVSDVLINTDIDDLAILPAGSRTAGLNEQLASKKMNRLMKELCTRYEDRIIVLDSPPLLATTEASVLARLAGQIVVVAASGQTTNSDLISALEQLDLSKVAGIVLNKSEDQVETAYYGSYYGSGARS